MKISIITATYNSGKTLGDTMRSVLSQSYPDYEHIIVDGASTDDTLDTIRRLEPLYHGRLKWTSQPDKGLYDAMNKGIAMASGQVIGILNSDDFYTSPHILTRIAAEMSGDGIDAIYGDIHFVDETDLHTCVRYYSSRAFHRWKMTMGYQPAHPSFYCRRQVYEKYGAFDLSFRVASDFEQMLRTLYLGRIKTRYVPMDFVTMRTGGASTAGLASHRAILRDHYRAYRKHRLPLGMLLDPLRYPLRLAEILLQHLRR